MKSKPIYAPLELDTTARRHLFITQGQVGLEAARRAIAVAPEVNAAILTMDDSAGRESHLDRALTETGMDTAFYIAGPEPFLWQIANRLREAGVENRRIYQEVAGSMARRVYCVHCTVMNEGVTTSIYRCANCGLALTVRDHFSRPLGAYMGVVVDAEAPGEVPEPEILYR